MPELWAGDCSRVNAEIGGEFFFFHFFKPSLTFEQQLELIIARGLIVRDRDRALHCLQRKGYFRLSAYFLPFKQRDHDGNYIDKFIPGSCFEDAILLYKFDADLRLLVIQAIDRVEIALRTSITYHLGPQRSPKTGQ